jgi:hypothetical protein
MKKIIVLALAIVMAGTMAACGMGDVGGPTSSAASQSVSSAPAAPKIDQKDMEDNLAGLQKYLAANSAVSGEPTAMKSDFIGAKSGVKYQFGFNGNNNVTMELYEFDTANLNEQAKTAISDVKAKGTFTIMSQSVAAVVSDNGKYLMIYKDTASSDENKAHHADVTKLFKEFKK